MYFQLYETHGNCFAYALYFSYIITGKGPSILLVNISDLIEEKVFRRNKYMKVKSDKRIKQLAYKCFVYNDFNIVKWLCKLITSNPFLIRIYETEWNSTEDQDKTDHGIPLIKSYTFKIYFSQFEKLLKDIKNTYRMTYDQITNWDKEVINSDPHINSGIEGSHEIDEYDYELTPSELSQQNKMGGNKRKKSNKSNKRKKTVKRKHTRQIKK